MTLVEPYSFDGVTQFVRRDDPDDRYSMAEVRTYDFGTEPIRTVIDAGAHIGSAACYLKTLWPDAQIVAIEPERENFEVLARNAAELTGVKAYYARVGYDPSPAYVVIHQDHSTCHRIVSMDTTLSGNQKFVLAPPAMTLEKILELSQWQTLDCLKIDAEGAEIDVFANCEAETLRRIRRIAGEFHNGFDFFMEGIGKRLFDLGFAISAERDPERHSTFVAIRE